MTEYKPTSRCPNCGRCPNVSFTEADVRRARTERQSARGPGVQCPRCSAHYWIRAHEIAAATPRPTRKQPESGVSPTPKKAARRRTKRPKAKVEGR